MCLLCPYVCLYVSQNCSSLCSVSRVWICLFMSVCQQCDMMSYSTCAEVITLSVLAGLQLKMIFTIDSCVDYFYDKLFVWSENSKKKHLHIYYIQYIQFSMILNRENRKSLHFRG